MTYKEHSKPASGTNKTDTSSRHWDENSFFAAYSQRHLPEVLQAARTLYDHLAVGGARMSWGRGKNDATVMPLFDDERGRQLYFSISTNGNIGLNLGGIKALPFSEEVKRTELIVRLKEVPGLAMPNDNPNGWPTFELNKVVEHSGFDNLVEVVDWAIQQIEESRQATA